MSGSSDRSGRRPPPGREPAPYLDPYEDVLTGPPTEWPVQDPAYQPQNFGTAPGDTPATFELTATPMRADPSPAGGLYAPLPEEKAERRKGGAPIVPAGSVTGRSLTMVIAIMCFLACLTAGAVYMINQSADAWLKDIASEVTVQIEPVSQKDIDKLVGDVAKFLEGQPGISDATALPLDQSALLLEPWLGQLEIVKSLPVPRLIAVQIDRSAPPDLEAVRAALAQKFKGVTLDDHRRWQSQIRTVTRSFALGGLAILLLVGAATTAIIVSATRSAMASNREIVEVLHFVGATDRFIAREFEKHFLRLGVRAGLVGAGCAMLVFLTMPTLMQLLGGGSVTAAELQQLIGTGSLDASGYALLAVVVFTISALCMVTSRVGVFRILNNKH